MIINHSLQLERDHFAEETDLLVDRLVNRNVLYHYTQLSQ